MKQKLLLALFVLFASVGAMRAADGSDIKITAPYNSGEIKVTFSVNSGGLGDAPTIVDTKLDKWPITSNSYVVTLPNNTDNTDKEWTITRGNSKYTNILVENSVKNIKKIDVNDNTIIKFTANNIGLKDLSVASSSLLELSFTNNAVAISDLNLSASVLQKLYCNDNNLKGTLIVPRSLTAFNCSNNQLLDITGTSVAGTFGTQTLKSTATTNPANEWSDLTNLVGNTANQVDIFDGAESTMVFDQIQKQSDNGTWGSAGTSRNGSTNQYKFQSSFYESGNYRVRITNTSIKSKTYLVEFAVQAAKFTLKHLDNVGLAKYDVALVKRSPNAPTAPAGALATDAAVYQGDIISLTAKAITNYTFASFETAGLKTPLEAGSSIQAEIVGPRPSDDLDAQIVTVKALFNTNKRTITLGSVAEGGSFNVVNKSGTEIKSNTTVEHGTELTIVATANDKYMLDIITINGNTISNGDIETIGLVSKYKFEVDADKDIRVAFKPISGSTKTIMPTFPEICVVKINNVLATNATPLTDNLLNTTTFNVIVTPHSGKSINVKNITINNVNAEKIIVSSDRKSFTATFTTKAEVTNLTLSVVAVELVPMTITPKTVSPQAEVYDGTAKPFQYITVPAGLQCSVTYSDKVDGTYTTTAPVNQGTYHVKYKRNADDKYAANSGSTDGAYTLVIAAAPLILTAPTVGTSASNGITSYTISGGSASFNGKTVTGSFVPNYVSGKAFDYSVPADKIGSAHMVVLTFVPKSDADKKNFDYEEATVNVSVPFGNTKLDEYTIKGTLKDGIEVKIKNGAALLAHWKSSNTSGVKIPCGAEITMEFVVPEGVNLTKVYKDEAGYASLTLVDKVVTIATATQTKDAILKFALSTETVAAKIAYEVESVANYEPTYSGAVQLYPTTPAAASGSYDASKEMTEGNHPILIKVKKGTSDYTLSYKYNQNGQEVASPIAAGSYDVEVTLTPGATDAVTMKATTATVTMIVKKGTPTIITSPTASRVGKNQKLESSVLTGGSGSVVGTFEWLDKTIIPENGKSYVVVFKPTDSQNYGVVYSSGAKDVKVEVTDKAIISLAAENGSITAKDASGRTYKSGDEVTTGTILTFTTTPIEGYELLTPIKVNGTAISGTTYTVAGTSITVTADFTAKPFTVTVTTPTKGLIVTLPASNKVKAGGSYVITLAHLAADKPVVKDGSTVITGTGGKYTISNIMANKAITITLDAPTAIAVKADATLSPQGRPMGTIVLTGLTDGKCYYGDKITAKATPVSGVQFSGWNGLTSTENPLTMTVTGTLTLKALYLGSPTGIDDIEGTKVYGAEGYIYVSCEGQATVTVVTMDGRSQQVRIVGEARIETGAGIYGVILQQGAEVLKTKVVVR